MQCRMNADRSQHPPCQGASCGAYWFCRCNPTTTHLDSDVDIWTYLHHHSDSLVTQRDINNRMALTWRELRDGQSSSPALVDHLHREGSWCCVKLDTNNRLTAIFFAHPDSVAYPAVQCRIVQGLRQSESCVRSQSSRGTPFISLFEGGMAC